MDTYEPATPKDGFARRTTQLVAIALAAGAGLFLAWQAAPAILVLFAGILFGVLLDACVRALGRILPIGRRWRLAVVCIAFVAAIAAAMVWGGMQLVAQADALIATLAEQLRTLRGELQGVGIDPQNGADGQSPERNTDIGTLAGFLIPDPEGFFGQATTAFNVTLGVVGNMVVIAFVGLFVAASPNLYKRGFLRLLPLDKRPRVGAVMDELGGVLRWWLVGQLVAMALIAVSTGAAMMLLGMPGSLMLGLQAGLFSFIPYLGPVIGGLPIALTALPVGMEMVLWALGVYVVIQTIEGYLFTPLIQRRAVHLPPLLTLAALALFGALFGLMGVALATPIAAALRVAVLRLYVEDALERRAGPEGPPTRVFRPRQQGARTPENGIDPGRPSP